MKLCFNVTLAALALRVKALWGGDLALEFIKFVCVGFIKITSPLFTDHWLGLDDDWPVARNRKNSTV